MNLYMFTMTQKGIFRNDPIIYVASEDIDHAIELVEIKYGKKFISTISCIQAEFLYDEMKLLSEK